MDEVLRRLERWLGKHRPSYLAQLQPGLTDAEYQSFEAQPGELALAALLKRARGRGRN